MLALRGSSSSLYSPGVNDLRMTEVLAFVRMPEMENRLEEGTNVEVRTSKEALRRLARISHQNIVSSLETPGNSKGSSTDNLKDSSS